MMKANKTIISIEKTFILITAAILVISCPAFTDVFANASDTSLNNNTTYKIVQVSTGDSLWSIASRYVTNKEDIREVILSIKRINQLDNNAQIYPGQIIKIPSNTTH